MIRSLTSIVVDKRARNALRVASELHRLGAQVISQRLREALRGEVGPDWRVVVEAMFADASSRAGDYLDAACRETWTSDKPERYELAVRALDACAPADWREMSGKERKAWLDNLPAESSERVLAYYAALSNEEHRRLTKWMRGKAEDVRGLLMFWLFDAKAEWAYRAQRARNASGLMLDLKSIVPALALPGSYALRRKSAEFAVQTISSYRTQHALWRHAIVEWREHRAAWEHEHPEYFAIRDDLFTFLKLPSSSKVPGSEPPRYHKLRPGAAQYYPAYIAWLAEHVAQEGVADQIEVSHREWVAKWADEPKPPTYSQIRNRVFGLQLQRNMGYRSLTVGATGDASIEALLPIAEDGQLAGTVDEITGFEWRTVQLRADRRLAALAGPQVGAARVRGGRQGRIYLSFKTDDAVAAESTVPLTPQLCAQYDARWVIRKAANDLGRVPRTVIAVFPFREGMNALLRYYDDYRGGVITKWTCLTGDVRLGKGEDKGGRRAGYSGTERGAAWRGYVDRKVETTAALPSRRHAARGERFAVKEASGYRNRFRDTARRIAAAVIEQAQEWRAELIVFDAFALRSSEDAALDRYRATVHRHLFIELLAGATKIGLCVTGVKVAARVQTCSRCGGRTIRTSFRRDQGEVYENFGERVRCLSCGSTRGVEHAVADNILAALNNRYGPVKPLRARIFDCAGVIVDFSDRMQVIGRLAEVTPSRSLC